MATSVFFFSDPMMGILAPINLLAILMPSPVGMRVLNDYRNQLKAGNDDPDRTLDQRLGAAQPSGQVMGSDERSDLSAKDGIETMRRGRRWPLRMVGSLFGISSCLIGLLSLVGMADQPELNRERATGFGIVALVVGVTALVGSLGARDVHALWYCSPRRWRLFRDDL